MLVRNYFRVENVVAARLAKGAHHLPPVKYATGCTLIHYNNDVSPVFHYYEFVGTGLNILEITGSTHSRVIQCLTSTGSITGFGEDLAKFPELADAPDAGHQPGHRPVAETPMQSEPSDGRLSTIYEEGEEHDLDAFMMEGWYDELRIELQPEVSHEDLYCIPTTMISDQCVLVTAVEDGSDPELGNCLLYTLTLPTIRSV